MKSDKLWTKDFILALITSFFMAMVFFIAFTTFAGYALFTYEVNESLAGLTASIFVFGAACGRLYSGKNLELIGRRKMLIISGFVFVIAGVAYSFAPNLPTFLIIRIIHGMAYGAFNTTIMAIVTNIIPVSRRGEGLGYFSLGFVVAIAIGPAIGMPFIEAFSYDGLLILIPGLAVLALIMAFTIKIEKPEFTEDEMASLRKKTSFFDMFEKKAIPAGCVIVLLSMCFTSITSFLATYSVVELDLPKAASFFFIVNGVAILIVRPVAGRLFDTKGDNFVMYPSIIFFSASVFLLSFATTNFHLVLVAILMALGYGNVLIMGQTIAINASPPQNVGKAIATYFVFCDLGQGTGPMLYGLIATHDSFRTMYFVGGFVVAFTFFIYYILHGRKAKRKNAA